MPDADDFDVEYFRNLLKGATPKDGADPHARPSLPAAKKKARPSPAPAAAKGTSNPPVVRKKVKGR